MFANINSPSSWFAELKDFMDWLYQNSAENSWVRKERARFHDATLEEAGPEAYVLACNDFIYAFDPKAREANAEVKSQFSAKYNAVHQKIKAHVPISEGLMDIDRAAKIWLDRAELKRKAELIYIVQILMGVIVGAGLSVFLHEKYPADSIASSDSAPAHELDAALFVSYFVVTAITPVLWGSFYKEINQLPEKLSNSLKMQPIISSTPLFESVAWVLQIYVTLKFFDEAADGVDPYNWLALTLPVAALVAGNIVGSGVDRLRTLCQWKQASVPNHNYQLLVDPTPANPGNTLCSKIYNCLPKLW